MNMRSIQFLSILVLGDLVQISSNLMCASKGSTLWLDFGRQPDRRRGSELPRTVSVVRRVQHSGAVGQTFIV
jgi:hypothetical protein